MQATFTNSSYIFATLRLDETQVNGYGAAVAPRLMLPFKLDFSFPKVGLQRRLDMRRLSARLQFGNISRPHATSQRPLSRLTICRCQSVASNTLFQPGDSGEM